MALATPAAVAELDSPGLRRRDGHRHQHDAALRPQPARPAARRAGPARSLEIDHFCGGIDDTRLHRSLCPRRGHEQPPVQRLGRPDAGPSSPARRCRHHGQPHRTQDHSRPREHQSTRRTPLPSSPLLSGSQPHQQAFAKLKALLRAAKERTVEGLWSSLGHLLAEFKPDECANYIRNAGYVRSA